MNNVTTGTQTFRLSTHTKCESKKISPKLGTTPAGENNAAKSLGWIFRLVLGQRVKAVGPREENNVPKFPVR